MTSSSSYLHIRAKVDAASEQRESRVQVNQRALIDKILARYASAGAVYRELLQNSNDAEADTAEIYFSCDDSSSNVVTQVLYRNNGMPFRPQDWDRLKNIAEGNPNPEKIGAFGVGAYTMFSICEEPLVVSGNEALCFFWKGNALWTKTADATISQNTISTQGDSSSSQWTSFILPSRDPYQLPDMETFGEFLCASLTFTKHLKMIRVVVNDQERLSIIKTLVQEPRSVSSTPNKSSSSWFRRFSSSEPVTSSGIFTLTPNSIMEFVYRITIAHTPASSEGLSPSTSSLDARYISATAKTNIKADMARRMERVTKKQPPSSLMVQLFLNAQSSTISSSSTKTSTLAQRISQSFSPQPGKGRIFIGFRTSQTTGLGAHVAAPFVPTVEREAMDLQDATLRVFNMELLELTGMLMRFTLEDTMMIMIDAAWKQNASQREALLKQLEQERAAGSGHAKTIVAEQQAGNTETGADDTTADDATSLSTSGGLVGFAKFMARGVKKKIVSVVSTVEELMDDGAEYLRPVDIMPLSEEETQAVVLMRAFCPEQSTPDATVGMCIAEGFSKCVAGSPPVLTKSGVVKGDQARLPNNGIETFVEESVVRRVVFANAEEYHTVIAMVKKLELDDLLHALYSTTLEQEKLVFFFNWWTKYARTNVRGAHSYGLVVKDAIKFYPLRRQDKSNNKSGERSVISLRDVLFYVEKGSPLAKQGIPLPESALDSSLQEKIGLSVLTDPSLRQWFSPLPVEVYSSFVVQLPFMQHGTSENEQLRIDVLSILSKEYASRSLPEKIVFGGLIASLLADKKCIPYDATRTAKGRGAAVPGDLYVFSAELEAFEAVGSFFKASGKLKSAGVSEDFLLAVGVRKSVAIDFLFASLDTLQWSNDPKPLVEYLRSATLTQKDIQKLRQTRYLPAENNSAGTFGPSELYLPDSELRIFPFVRMLQWPSEPELSEKSKNGSFLVKLGMLTLPPLATVLAFISAEVKDNEDRIRMLDFVADRLGPHGPYHQSFARMNAGTKNKLRFVPCVTKLPFGEDQDQKWELHSPLNCYSNANCGTMGFPIIDPTLGDRAKLYGSLFQCPSEPEPEAVLQQLLQLIATAQSLQAKAGTNEVKVKAVAAMIVERSGLWYRYLSHRSSDFSKYSLDSIRSKPVIPGSVNGTIKWFRADEVFFRKEKQQLDGITEELFHVVDFNPFFATLGVKQEASTADLFQRLLANPQKVLDTLGSEEKYRSLLRRIAANPPFARVTPALRDSPFLLGYTPARSDDEEASPGGMTYQLLKAEQIYIIDNSFFARMFPVARAPPETDLEDFYFSLGSHYISAAVERKFEVVGRPSQDSELTKALKERVLARGPLLVSPNITSRPLVPRAESILTEKRFEVYEASNLLAVYALAGTVRRNATTCFSRPSSAMGVQGNAIFVVKDFDWFDVGYAIGDLILKRCQLEDAFFISSLLEAPIEQLKARGFPVERILKDEPSAVTAPKPGPPAVVAPKAAPPVPASSPTIAAIPNLEDEPLSESNQPANLHATTSGAASADASPVDTTERFAAALKQMFPDVDHNYLRNRLGSSPSMEKVQNIAEELSSSNYPRADSTSQSGASVESSNADQDMSDTSPAGKRKNGLRKKLGKAFNGLRPSSIGGMPPLAQSLNNRLKGTNGLLDATTGSEGNAGSVTAGPATSSKLHEEKQKSVPAVDDAHSHNNLNRLLENSVRSSNQVNTSGIHSSDTQITSIPEGLDRGETCEMIPGHSLKPFSGPQGSGMSSNGIRLFSARESPASEAFLHQNDQVIESFSYVLERLCGVYGLPKKSIAIFHDPSGGTIAFNAGKALHCNIRFFYSLYYLQGQQNSSDCYAYWFVTLAHELAHNMVSSHGKEHGFYTESYVTKYLPQLAGLLATL